MIHSNVARMIEILMLRDDFFNRRYRGKRKINISGRKTRLLLVASIKASWPLSLPTIKELIKVMIGVASKIPVRIGLPFLARCETRTIILPPVKNFSIYSKMITLTAFTPYIQKLPNLAFQIVIFL
jgi:hypothetical protein